MNVKKVKKMIAEQEIMNKFRLALNGHLKGGEYIGKTDSRTIEIDQQIYQGTSN